METPVGALFSAGGFFGRMGDGQKAGGLIAQITTVSTVPGLA